MGRRLRSGLQRQLARELEAHRRSYGVVADHLPEWLAVRAGLKQVTQITLHAHHDPEREEARVDRLCREAGLCRTSFARGGQHKLLISRTPIEPPVLGEDENKGNWFSYPSCCVEAYLANPVECYFVQRIGALVAPRQVYDHRMNPFLLHTPFHLLRQYPCSLTCERSLAGVQELLSLLERRTPSLASAIVRWNRRPALFLDVCGIGILFHGTLRRDRIEYEDSFYMGVSAELAPWSPRNTADDLTLFDDIAAAISEGNDVGLDGDVLTIRAGVREVGRFTRPAHLTWRILSFE